MHELKILLWTQFNGFREISLKVNAQNPNRVGPHHILGEGLATSLKYCSPCSPCISQVTLPLSPVSLSVIRTVTTGSPGTASSSTRATREEG